MSRWHRVCNPCVPKTCGLVQEYCVEQFILSVVNLLRRTIYIMSVHVCELRLHTSSEVVARPAQELITLYRMRRRDMARAFDSGVGTSITGLGMGSLDADDWCFAVAAMPGEGWGKVRIFTGYFDGRCGETNERNDAHWGSVSVKRTEKGAPKCL